MAKFNPFTPNSPAHKGMFVGRSFELEALDKALLQTSGSNPTHLLILGERGIGKTSLMNVAQIFGHGEFIWGERTHNFLTVRVSFDEKLYLIDFVLKLKKAIEREINKVNPEVALFNKAWDFISRFEVGGFSYNKLGDKEAGASQIIQDTAYSLVDTVKSLKDGSQLTEKKDGIVILLDEADKACPESQLGSFVKNLSETLISEGHNNVLFILTGLPNLREVLLKSHESSLRLFQEINLKPLSREETSEVIKKGLADSKEKSGITTTIDDKAVDLVFSYSEGYPHFVQQIGYSIFDTDTDDKISEEDTNKGFFSENGALEQIGDRYYRKLFYSDISTDMQRSVLKIMSGKWNGWIKREDIKKEFSQTDANLDNCLRALKDKNIIIPREGYKGTYRLQWASFAFWIKNHEAKDRSK